MMIITIIMIIKIMIMCVTFPFFGLVNTFMFEILGQVNVEKPSTRFEPLITTTTWQLRVIGQNYYLSRNLEFRFLPHLWHIVANSL